MGGQFLYIAANYGAFIGEWLCFGYGTVVYKHARILCNTFFLRWRTEVAEANKSYFHNNDVF